MANFTSNLSSFGSVSVKLDNNSPANVQKYEIKVVPDSLCLRFLSSIFGVEFCPEQFLQRFERRVQF